jgi:hypothetical protein
MAQLAAMPIHLMSMFQAVLQDSRPDWETIGEIVWAGLPENSRMLWPAECLDPCFLPRGRDIPRAAYAALNQSDRSAMQQRVDSLHQTPAASWLKKQADKLNRPKEREQAARVCKDAKVFVLYLGTCRWAWIPRGLVLPFSAHRECASLLTSAALCTRRQPIVVLRESACCPYARSSVRTQRTW